MKERSIIANVLNLFCIICLIWALVTFLRFLFEDGMMFELASNEDALHCLDCVVSNSNYITFLVIWALLWAIIPGCMVEYSILGSILVMILTAILLVVMVLSDYGNPIVFPVTMLATLWVPGVLAPIGYLSGVNKFIDQQ